MEAIGSATEVKLLGDGDEVAEVSEFYVAIHTLEIIMVLNKILDVMEFAAQS